MDVDEENVKVEDENGEDNDDMEEDLSSDENDDDGQKTQTQIEELSTKLKTSPFEYQAHITLIQLLRNVGEFEKLRDARSHMADTFPLTQKLWLEWIEDEKKFADTEDDHIRIVELFEKAVKDYMCPEVWLEYAQYCIRWMDMEDGLIKIRQVMERSIVAVGLHVTEGAALWEMYREFENAILLTTQPTPGSVPSADQQEKMKKQSDRVKSLFKRQLAIPLQDMANTFQEFTDWCEDDIDLNTKLMFKQSSEQMEALQPFEEELSKATAPKFEAYQNYIQHEIKSGSPVRVQHIYERALVENCLNSELWLQYLKYMGYQFNSTEILVGLHHRSVRNCPWIGQLWVLYLLSLERNSASKEKLDGVFTEALSAGFTTAYEYVELWKTKCSQIRRKISQTDSQEKEELRENFIKATSYITDTLIPAYSESGDPDFTMWTFWARCEASCIGNKDKAMEILSTLTEGDADAKRKICIWREMYNIERLFGNSDEKTDKCRSILRQAVQNCAILPDSEKGGIPDAEVACNMLLDFEREFGSIQDMDESLRRVTNKMSRVMKRREKQAAVYANQQARKKEWQSKQPSGKSSPGAKKRKLTEEPNKSEKGSGDYHKHAKRSKQTKPAEQDKDFKTPSALPVRFGNKTKPASEQDAISSKKSGPPPGFKGSAPEFKTPPPPGYKGKPPPGYKPKPSDLNNNKGEENVTDKAANVEETPAGDIDSDVDKNTIFVSNLDFKLQNIEEKLRNVFCDCGKIVDIRLAKNNKGQFRGFGFIEFDEHSAVEKALELDRQELDGRPLFVSPNVDKRKQPNFKIFKFELGMEKHKLFVSNLSFHTTEDTLRTVFSEHGVVKEIRIVTNRKGLSKGLAYIEYENEGEAAQAILKTDGKEIDGFAIQVAISNPPSRKPNAADATSSLGGGNRDQTRGGRGRGRTQLSMMPRSVRRSDVQSSQNGSSSVPSTSSGGMSNKDFANLLLKK